VKRHRGTYNSQNPNPYELSRSAIEQLVRCEACFWLQKVKGVKTPRMPGFNLNTNTDTLLKKDFNLVRGKGPNIVMKAAGLEHLRPFSHQNLDKWTESLHFGAAGRFHVDHPETNIRFGGGVDDIWENIDTGVLHIVDYKSTAQITNSPKPLDQSFIAPPDDPAEPDYKAGFRRQMDMYQWVLRKLGFEVSNTGYFLYVDGQHIGETGMLDNEDPSQAWMRFNVALIPYEGDDSWVNEALHKAKRLISEVTLCPEHSNQCEYGRYLKQVTDAS
jgi:hypothetical protein